MKLAVNYRKLGIILSVLRTMSLICVILSEKSLFGEMKNIELKCELNHNKSSVSAKKESLEKKNLNRNFPNDGSVLKCTLILRLKGLNSNSLAVSR